MKKPKIKKLTYKELLELIHKHNALNKVERQFEDKNALQCVIVFKNESWPHRRMNYSLKSRSYRFRSDNKRFISGMGGNSIFAECLDGSDEFVRLDYYLGDWKIDYCYIMEGADNEGRKDSLLV